MTKETFDRLAAEAKVRHTNDPRYKYQCMSNSDAFWKWWWETGKANHTFRANQIFKYVGIYKRSGNGVIRMIKH